MKLSLLLTALILTAALLTGWRQHRAAERGGNGAAVEWLREQDGLMLLV